jgi:phosphatidylserine decarboxylase
MVGALLVGSIATVPAGEVNPPPTRGGVARDIADGIGRSFAKGDELGRFNMGSTVVVLWRTGPSRFDPRLGVGCKLRMGQPLARLAVTDG